MTLKCLDASSALYGRLLNQASSGRRELPHFDRLVQTAADKIPSIRRECNAVDTVLVAVGTFQALEQESSLNLPDPNALVQRASRYTLGIGRNSNSCYPVFYSESQNIATRLDVPQSDSAVATSGGNRASVTGKVKRINILFVACESVPDGLCGNVPDTDQLVFGSGSQILAVGAEADASDIEITVQINVLVLQNANLLSRSDIVDLSRSVAPGRNILAVGAEPNTADDAFVLQGVDKVDVEDARDSLIEDDPPIILHLLNMVREALWVQVAQRVVRDGRGASGMLSHARLVGGGMVRNLRRLAGPIVGDRGVDLGSSRTSGGPPDCSLLGSRGGGALERLRREPTGRRSL